MNSVRTLLSRPASWFAIALVGALTGVALHVAVDGAGSPSVSAVAVITSIDRSDVGPDVGDPVAGQPPLAAGPAIAAVEADESAGIGGDGPRDEAAPSSPRAVVSSDNATGIRVRIPVLGVDARVVSLGFASDGQLAVPRDGTSVGWYEISPRPGQSGNALLGAHFDWGGSLAVFAGLSRLAPGDRVFVEDGSDSELAYEVSEATSVAWDSPVADILAAGSAGSSLTLFTCGGSFDQSRGEYNQRVVVRAVQVEGSTPLTARR